MAWTDSFDPDGAAAHDGLFGLPCPAAEALVQVVPVPWDVTTSYRPGTAGGPDAVLQASFQVDLDCPFSGDAWRAGITLLDAPAEAADSEALRALAALARAGDDAALARVNAACAALDASLRDRVAGLLGAGRIPAVLGGDHGTALGGLQAAAATGELGVLHVDAHADLRVAYEGFERSHASVLHNALATAPFSRLVQVGVRDQSGAERARAASDPRIAQHRWHELAGALGDGAAWTTLVRRILQPLPERVWITWDIDGLDPALCPATGTPVPGGLSWDQADILLAELRASGRRIVGFDLVEVGAEPWDAIVGARLLHRLAGHAIRSREGILR